MQPEKIRQLDPHYANEMRFANIDAMHGMHEAAAQLDQLVNERGEVLDVFMYGTILDYIREYLTLDTDYEAFLEARLMPPHDSFTSESGTEVPSRFLIVDARSPLDVPDPEDADPSMRIRAYFVLLGERAAALDGGGAIFPYYVVSEREITGQGTEEETIHNVESHVFHARYAGGRPLETGFIEPRLVHEIEPYEAMQAELQGAFDRLTQST